MSDLQVWFDKARYLPGAIANDLQGFGGFLRCETCGDARPLGDVGAKLTNGWPKHCGYTMRWWTQRQIDAGEVPPVRSRSGE
jgi:hypothetical protein